jgi:hypothetical protein
LKFSCDGIACGKKSPVRSYDIIAAIAAWNETVDPGA